MDFSFDAEQLAFRDSVVKFAKTELHDDVVQRDRKGDFNAVAFKKCAEFGIQGLPIPAAYGGSDADPLTVVIAMEALGYGCQDNGLLFSINAQMWSFELPILSSAPRSRRRNICHRYVVGKKWPFMP